MHVLFLGWDYPPFASGVGMYMRNMARALVSSGYKATVMCAAWQGEPEEFFDEGVHVLRCFQGSNYYSSEIVRTVLRYVDRHGVDYIEGADHLGIAAQLFSCKMRPPIIIKVHSSNALQVLRGSQILYKWQHPLLWLAYLRSFRQFYFEQKSYYGADCLIAPSKAILTALTQQGLTLPKCHEVVYNPISPEIPVHEGNEPMVSKRILFAGRLDIGKGIEFLPRLMQNLRHTGVILEIAGGDSFARGIGSLQKWLESKLGRDNQCVVFHGQVPADEMDKLYKRCSLVIVPSRWDNFPTVVLEAMKHAVPVVASHSGGMVEMLDGTDCNVCDPSTDQFAEQVKKYLNNPVMARKAGESMRMKMLEFYNPESVVRQYCKALAAIGN